MNDLLMFLLSYFVNKGMLEIHWNIDAQNFIYVVSEPDNCDEEEEQDIEIDADDILNRMLNRKKKQ